jgi:hypothetical protein|tara:strand:- start:4087 stop:4575 length:489 start_codon:yes stop_codon:yes gene_type:complete
MATVAQIANATLGKILVQDAEGAYQASEYQDFIFSLNTYMLALDADGIALGYTEVSNLADTVTVPTGALRGIIYNMAVEVSDEYGGTVTQTLQRIADESLVTMRKLGVSIGETSFPSTLPIGSGNEGLGSIFSSHFYPDEEDQILAETTGALALEAGTEAAI